MRPLQCDRPVRTIVHVLPYMAEGGTEKHVLTLLRGLQNSYNCILLAPKGKILPEFLRLDIRYIEFPEIKGFFPAKIRAFKKLLSDVARVEGVDLVHVHAAHEFVSFVRKVLPHVPIIFHLSAHQGSAISKMINYRLSARISRKKADLLIAVSEEEKRIIVGKGFPEERVRIVYNGYEQGEDDDFEQIRRIKAEHGMENRLIIGNLGRIHRTKRLHLLIEAFAKGRNRVGDMKLLFVGDGPEMKRLEAHAHRLGIGDDTIFLGFVKRGDRILKIFDIFILPTSFEGCSNVLVEAMAKQLPIIATDIPSVRWMFEDGVSALLFRDDDVEDLTEKLLTLARDQELRKRIGYNAFTTFQKNFNARIMVEKVIIIYRSLFAGKNR